MHQWHHPGFLHADTLSAHNSGTEGTSCFWSLAEKEQKHKEKGANSPRNTWERNRKIFYWTQQSCDDLYPLQIRSLIYKSRLPKGSWGSWSKFSCVTPTLHQPGPKHHLQKQQQLPCSWQLLMYEAEHKLIIRFQVKFAWLAVRGNLILMCKLK